MSFRTSSISPGVLLPEELDIVESVYDKIAAEAWFTDDEAERSAFAAHVIASYQRGLTDPEKLLQFCEVAAKGRFRKHGEAEL